MTISAGVMFYNTIYVFLVYSKTCHKRPLKKDQKLVFNTDYRLMQVKSIAECSKRAFCNTLILWTFIKLPLILSLRPLFCLFLSGRLRQVLLYIKRKRMYFKIVWLNLAKSASPAYSIFVLIYARAQINAHSPPSFDVKMANILVRSQKNKSSI